MNSVIKTPCGEIRGTECRIPGITAYKGIRYATAERWKYPEVVSHWDGIYDATSYGSCCYQLRTFHPEDQNPGKTFYYNEFRKGETYTYSEDCLFLNIWTPHEAKIFRFWFIFMAAHSPEAAGMKNISTVRSGRRRV